MSDFDDSKSEDYTSLRNYVSDIESNCDFDITSSCSMDLLTGKLNSECYFSDTESLGTKKVLASNKPCPINYLKFLKSNDDSPSQWNPAVSSMHLMNYSAIPGNNNRSETKKMVSMSKQLFNKNPCSFESNSLGTIRIEAGPATADEDFETSSFPSSLDFISKRNQETTNSAFNIPASCFTSMKVEIPNSKRDSGSWSTTNTLLKGPTSPGVSSLSNVKLPYATPNTITSVPSSFSSCSLSKIEFNNEADATRGSCLSLASTGSCRSLNEERQAQEIRKLRRELEMAQQKIKTLSSQLTTNVHVVAAFEQSLASMTSRLKSLTSSAEEKESELTELRNTIESLKLQSNVMLLGTSQINEENNIKGDLQPSESITSLVSDTSLAEEDKKPLKLKKSGWFMQSLGKAFKKKSSKSDLTLDLSADNAIIEGSNCNRSSSVSLKTTDLSEINLNMPNMDQLRRELEEKDLRLTDVQLDALSSAHQLDQLRDLMTEMKNEMSTLKADNERLQRIVFMCTNSDNEQSIQSLIKENRSANRMSTNSENIQEDTDSIQEKEFDFLAESTLESECKRFIVSVRLDNFISAQPGQSDLLEIDIGYVSVNSCSSWQSVNVALSKLFHEYIFRIDPDIKLGLTNASIHSYHIGNISKLFNKIDSEPFPLTNLCSTGDNKIRIYLHGNLMENLSAMDALAFATLIPKTVLQRYISLLSEHRRIIICGPSGTGKTFLANALAKYLVIKENKQLSTNAIVNFKVDLKSYKELRSYLCELAEQIESKLNPDRMPTVIILDDLHHVTSLSDVFGGFLSVKDSKCPFIIGTMNQTTYPSTNLQLHHNFRWIMCANHIEPVKGLLRRVLQRKLSQFEIETCTVHRQLHKVIEWIPKVWQHINRFLETHSSSDAVIGPRLFLSCPMNFEGSKIWFTDLWNFSLVPYILEAVREGLAQYGKRAKWEDPLEWITISWPWTPSSSGMTNLMCLRPEDVGYEKLASTSSNLSNISRKTEESSCDPFRDILLRLQEVDLHSGNQTDK